MWLFVGSFFGANFCETVRPMLSVRCLTVLSVCDVGALWQNGWWIKMKLGAEVGLGPGRVVLDGDQLPLPKGYSPLIFGPRLLWPNGRVSQLLPSTCYTTYRFGVTRLTVHSPPCVRRHLQQVKLLRSCKLRKQVNGHRPMPMTYMLYS